MEDFQPVTGIVAEFNPFHNGHKYLLSQAEGIKIVVMSGNWLQRGEPAIVDKWTRTEMALNNGADIVLEMPVLASVQSADFFAQGAINQLKALKINRLVFGTESDDDYKHVADVYREKKDEMEAYLKELPDSLSYPQKTQDMWTRYTDIRFDGDSPNHILALAYIKALKDYQLEINPVKRLGQGFHSPELAGDFASATAIRKNIDDSEAFGTFVPEDVLELLAASPKVTWDDFFPYLKYKIISSDISNILQMNEELAVRIKKNIAGVNNIDDLIDKVYTKRYTKARIRRLLVYVLLDIDQFSDYSFDEIPTSVRILGFTRDGQKYLKTVKNDLELVSRIGSKPWNIDSQKADEIYQLGNSDLKEQNFGRVPVINKKKEI